MQSAMPDDPILWGDQWEGQRCAPGRGVWASWSHNGCCVEHPMDGGGGNERRSSPVSGTGPFVTFPPPLPPLTLSQPTCKPLPVQKHTRTLIVLCVIIVCVYPSRPHLGDQMFPRKWCVFLFPHNI